MFTGNQAAAGRVRSAAMRSIGALAIVIVLIITLTAPSLAQTEMSPDRVYFSPTGHYLSFGFLDYWRHEGALMTFGYPISEEIVDTQSGLTVQYFERAVFEYHPDAPDGWKVQLQRLGSEATADRQGEQAFQPVAAATDQHCTYFEPTGHRLCFGIRDYWQNNGALRIFGYPISEEFAAPETGLTVQYFERARFEYHPDNPPAYQVLLGLLGRDAAAMNNVDTSPLPPSPDVPEFNAVAWTPERCRAWQLDLERTGGDAGAGHRNVIFAFQNDSQISCTLYGYPGMLMLDTQGQPLPTDVHWGGGTAITNIPPSVVLLNPGDFASFAAGYAAIPTGNQSHEDACPASARLLVTPPNDFDQLAISTMIDPCEGDIYVSPVVAGPSGP